MKNKQKLLENELCDVKNRRKKLNKLQRESMLEIFNFLISKSTPKHNDMIL